MPTQPLSVDLVTAHVAAATGREVTGVESLPGSVANQDFLVRLVDDPPVVLKAGPRSEMAAEAWVCRRLTEIGLPVPGVVGTDLGSGQDAAVLILTFVPGAPSESPAVAFEAGRCMRRVHDEQPPGWGPLVVDAGVGGATARGAFDSWAEAVHAGLDDLPALVDADVLDPELAAVARSCVLVDELLGYEGPAVLLHRDLKPAHLFGIEDGRRLSAIIDWGDAHVGDPAADLARLSMAGPVVTEAFLAGYDCEPSDDLAELLARYRVLWDVTALSYEYRAGGDWFDVYRNRLRSDTRLLTG